MKGPGQPTKLSIELAKRIAARIRRGQTMADSAEAEGIDRSSLFNYMKDSSDMGEEFRSIIAAAIEEGKRPKQAG